MNSNQAQVSITIRLVLLFNKPTQGYNQSEITCSNTVLQDFSVTVCMKAERCCDIGDLDTPNLGPCGWAQI